MPGTQREPCWLRAPASSYLKGIGSVASSLPLASPDKGSISGFFELISVWGETAHFQLPTPRGEWRGPLSGSEGSSDLPVGEPGELQLVGPGSPWFRKTRLWLGGTPSPIGRVSGSGLGRVWVVFELPPLPATERVRPGMGIWVVTECLLSYDDVTPVQSGPNPMCAYPDVLLYILSFPCFRVARILKRFVT